MRTRSRDRRPPRGFTVVELAISGMMMALLGILLSATWANVCGPAVDAAARCRIAQEANLAAASLARDLGGSLANPEGRLGAKTDGQFVGRMQPTNAWLRLCFHGGTGTDFTPKWGPPDTVISYQLQSGSLIRWDENAGTVFTVATALSGFSVTPLDDNSGVVIALTFTVRDLTTTYTLVAHDPPAP